MSNVNNYGKRRKISSEDIGSRMDEQGPSSSSEEIKQKESHPLMIPSVIESVISFLLAGKGPKLIKHFKNARLVCSKWNDAGINVYRRQIETQLTFGGEDDQKSVNREVLQGLKGINLAGLANLQRMMNMPLSSEQRLMSFMKDSDGIRNLLFTKFNFRSSFFKKHDNLPVFKTFLSTHSHWITKLTIEFEVDPEFKCVKKDWTDLKLDVLEELDFECNRTYPRSSWLGRNDPSHSMGMVHLLEVLLKASKNLKKLRFARRFCDPPQNVTTAFGATVSTHCPKTVEKLHLDLKLTKEQIEKIIGLNLTLTELYCELRQVIGVPEHEALNKLIEQQKDTLVELGVSDLELDIQLNFPVFKKLKTFRIQGNAKMPFSYPQNFPVLKTLVLDSCTNYISKIMMESSPCETLRNLVLLSYFKDKSQMLQVKKIFPNIKKLQFEGPITLAKEFLSCVFEHLTQIEQLVLLYEPEHAMPIFKQSQNLDSIFTGFSPNVCKKLEKMDLSEANIDDSNLMRKPSIINMTKLKQLMFMDQFKIVSLTDVTAVFGFMKIDTLKEFESPSMPMSKKVVQKLRKKMKVTFYDQEVEEEEPEEDEDTEVEDNQEMETRDNSEGPDAYDNSVGSGSVVGDENNDNDADQWEDVKEEEDEIRTRNLEHVFCKQQ